MTHTQTPPFKKKTLLTRVSQAQINAAFGKTFEAPRVLDGCSRVRFWGIYPSGNVGVKRETDPVTHGPVTVSCDQAAPLLEAISHRFNRRGQRNAAS